MAQLVDLYKAQQSQLGVDKIKVDPASSAARNTPYSTNDLQKIDSGVVSEERLKTARGGSLKTTKYSDTVKK